MGRNRSDYMSNSVMVCGASAAFLNHKAGEPTWIDNIMAALSHSSNARRESTVEYGAPAHGIAR